MFDLGSLALFMTATLALNLAPDPDMLYVSTRSLTQGRRADVISALGIAAGSVVHTVAIASGLAALLRAMPLAHEIGSGRQEVGSRAEARPTTYAVGRALARHS